MKERKEVFMKSTSCFLLISVLAGIFYADMAYAETETLTSKQIIGILPNKECLACGADYYTNSEIFHPMASALIISTASLQNDIEMVNENSAQLLENATQRNNGIGWGIDFAWDAFSDGSVNPKNTIYGITVAISVKALLDAYVKTKKPNLLENAIDALGYYSQFSTETEDGICFWYSDQRSDDICVYNVSSMLMGQYARAGAISNNIVFKSLATKAFRRLIANIKVENAYSSLPYWPYSNENPQPNDLVHAVYTIQGIIEYQKAFRGDSVSEAHVEYLTTFFQKEMPMEFSSVHKLPSNRSEKPARLWGLGMAIYTLSDLKKCDLSREFISKLDNYRTPSGFKNNPTIKNENEVRMLTHLSLGLAKFEKKCSD